MSGALARWARMQARADGLTAMVEGDECGRWTKKSVATEMNTMPEHCCWWLLPGQIALYRSGAAFFRAAP